MSAAEDIFYCQPMFTPEEVFYWMLIFTMNNSHVMSAIVYFKEFF